MPFPKLTDIGHALIPPFVRPGDTLVDATCGNGRDTLFLARLPGPEGLVYAIDIQAEALEETKRRMESVSEKLAPVRYIQGDHRYLDQYVDHSPSVILFNLGYLPGGDHQITTVAESTLEAINKSIALLKKGGLLLTTLYPGHSEGRREANAIEEFLSSLSSKDFRLLKIAYHENRETSISPYILALEKRKEGNTP